MDIRCRKLNCVYNDRFSCKAKTIEIDKDIKCQIYQQDKEKSAKDKPVDIFGDDIKFAPQRECKKDTIVCSADCLFNHNGSCVSNGITVNHIKNCPYCVSYLHK